MTTTDTSAPAQGSPFWRFSLRFYRIPAVADACIALQDEFGVDVNLLLFLLWHAAQGHALSPPEVAGVEARIAAWRESTVIPLRALRRALKESPQALVVPATAEAFRNRIKAVELEAERLQQEAMYALACPKLLGEDAPSLAEAARANIAAYETARAKNFPKGVVDILLAGCFYLSRQSPEG